MSAAFSDAAYELKQAWRFRIEAFFALLDIRQDALFAHVLQRLANEGGDTSVLQAGAAGVQRIENLRVRRRDELEERQQNWELAAAEHRSSEAQVVQAIIDDDDHRLAAVNAVLGERPELDEETRQGFILWHRAALALHTAEIFTRTESVLDVGRKLREENTLYNARLYFAAQVVDPPKRPDIRGLLDNVNQVKSWHRTAAARLPKIHDEVELETARAEVAEFRVALRLAKAELARARKTSVALRLSFALSLYSTSSVGLVTLRRTFCFGQRRQRSG